MVGVVFGRSSIAGDEIGRDAGAEIQFGIGGNRFVAFQLEIVGREQQLIGLRLPFQRIEIRIGAALVPVGDDFI